MCRLVADAPPGRKPVDPVSHRNPARSSQFTGDFALKPLIEQRFLPICAARLAKSGENSDIFEMISMALLPILCYPNPKLHTVAKAVDHVDDRIRRLVVDMLQTMYEAKGVGLAATQVDVHERLIVLDVSDERDKPMVLINPRIVWNSEERHLNEEGCLSVPGIYDGVERFDAVHVEALDALGELRKIEAEGILAVCVQHEMDHLLGKVFVEYLSPLKRDRIKKKMLKAQRDEQEEAATAGKRKGTR